MNKYELLALAMQVHMKLLRTLRRNTDIDWLAEDVAYIREIQRVCREHGSSEMRMWAERLEDAAASIQLATQVPRHPGPAATAALMPGDFEDTRPTGWDD